MFLTATVILWKVHSEPANSLFEQARNYRLKKRMADSRVLREHRIPCGHEWRARRAPAIAARLEVQVMPSLKGRRSVKQAALTLQVLIYSYIDSEGLVWKYQNNDLHNLDFGTFTEPKIRNATTPTGSTQFSYKTCIAIYKFDGLIDCFSGFETRHYPRRRHCNRCSPGTKRICGPGTSIGAEDLKSSCIRILRRLQSEDHIERHIRCGACYRQVYVGRTIKSTAPRN